nr:retrovirus-related Pol polyprotein from transposon TNT 1-94 [Tanacetum cinerariifolium]
MVSWSSKKQYCTAMSTAKAKYVSLSTYCAQIIWMRTQLLNYGYRFNKIMMYCYSKSAIAISCNPNQHSRTKHINIHYHFIKEHVERGTFELYFIGTEYQLADLFTKALPKEIFEYLVHRIANKRFELEEVNKKIDLVQPSCPPSSKILRNILMRHPLRFVLTASASVLWIYIQFISTVTDTREIFSTCLTTKVTGIDQPPFQIMQMIYCFVNNVHVDYAVLIWEALHYSYLHPAATIPYPRFIKMIIHHIMTENPDIPKRNADFRVDVDRGDEAYWALPVVCFSICLDVPTTRSQLIESTQRKIRTPSVLKPPNPVEHQGESSAQRKLTMSIATSRSLKDLKAQQNVKRVKEYLVDEEIEKIVEGNDDVDENQFVDEIQNSQEDPDTRIEPQSHKERPEVEKSVDLIIIDDQKEKESVEDALRRKKRKVQERILKMSRRYGNMFRHLRQSFMPRKDFKAITEAVHATLKKVVPSMVDKTTNDIVKKNPSKVVADGIRLERQKVQNDIAALAADVVQKERESIRTELSVHITHDGESSAKRQKTSEHGMFTTGIDDDEVPSEQVTPELLDEVSEKVMTFDELQRMKNALTIMMRIDVIQESIEEDLTEQIPKKPAPVFLSCIRNLKIPPMSLVKQDLFYLKNGNPGAKKYVPSLHKIHAFPFPKNDLEELDTRWMKKTIKIFNLVKKTIKKFNLYARYAVDHWKSPWVQQDQIRRQLKTRDDPEKVYSEVKIVDGIKEEKMLTITCVPVIGLIYENNKRVMDIKQIPKFCDATLKRVLEKVNKFNLDVKHGYADQDLSNEDAKYMIFMMSIYKNV